MACAAATDISRAGKEGAGGGGGGECARESQFEPLLCYVGKQLSQEAPRKKAGCSPGGSSSGKALPEQPEVAESQQGGDLLFRVSPPTPMIFL